MGGSLITARKGGSRKVRSLPLHATIQIISIEMTTGRCVVCVLLETIKIDFHVPLALAWKKTEGRCLESESVEATRPALLRTYRNGLEEKSLDPFERCQLRWLGLTDWIWCVRVVQE